MTGPLVSVIVPCFNGGRFLPAAVASIRAQQYEPLEILVVDDASTDDTPQVMAALPGAIRCFRREENGGPAATRNTGLREASGAYIAFLDSDDQWPEYKLERQVRRLVAEPELDIVTGCIQYVASPGAKPPKLQFDGPDRAVANIHLGAALFRRRIFDAIGLFDESLRMGEDQDLFLRARESGLKIVVTRDVMLVYRVHGANMTLGAGACDLGLAEVLRRSLLRRRQKQGVAQELKTWSSFKDGRPPNA